MTDANFSFPGTFTAEQTQALLAPINPRRIFQANGQSHVPFFEVTAHLIRMFGFGNHAVEVLETKLIFEQVRPDSMVGTFESGSGQNRKTVDRATNPQLWKYDHCYSATVRLTIFDREHNVVTTFENASTGDASNQTRADGHDLALKTAISTATKRCAINLGDQFGLSLYNRGREAALVMGTKVMPADMPTTDQPPKDPSDGLEQVQGDGIDELPGVPEQTTAEQEAMLASSLGAKPIEEPNADHTETVQS